MHTSKRRARARTRILYWFRTPPGIRVGRAALDEDAIKLIEECHPHIRFDWQQILKGEEEAAPPARRVQPESVPGPQEGPTPVAPIPIEPISPAHALSGSEGLARLRARYADVMAGIARLVTDPDKREQLRTSAERLNPDNWVTTDEVQLGLEQYEVVFDSLRGLVARRRRRRKPRRSAELDRGQPATHRHDAEGAPPARDSDADANGDEDAESDPTSQD